MTEFFIICTLIITNIIQYSGFLLLIYMEYIITPIFIPHFHIEEYGLMNLLIFAVLYLFGRPLGGYFLGRLADIVSVEYSILTAIKINMITALTLTILPSYEFYPVLSMTIFIMIRIVFSFTIGGTYVIIGARLMELNNKYKGLLSSMLLLSIIVANLLSLAISYSYKIIATPASWWRVPFLIHIMLNGLLYFVIKICILERNKKLGIISNNNAKNVDYNFKSSIILVTAIGMLTAVTTWLPTNYAYFYLIKILAFNEAKTLEFIIVAIISYATLLPFLGILADRITTKKNMVIFAILTPLLNYIAFELLKLGHVASQLIMAFTAASFGANIHIALMKIFKKNHMQNISLFFNLGLGIGVFLLYIVGYYEYKLNLGYLQIILTSIIVIPYLLIIGKSENTKRFH